jgi:GDP-D-mannose 3',5'-epimerase
VKTVVTGGAGFIGCHLVKELLDAGREVVVVDNFSRGSLENLRDVGVEDVKCIRADLRSYAQSLAAVKDAETVYHLAAVVGGVEYLHGSEMAELKALLNNVVIDANIFRACMQHKVKKIVYASSASVYPIDLQQKLGAVLFEEDLRYYNPERGYGWAKLIGEIELSWMKNVDIGIARIFTTYGPCESLDETSHVVPALIRKAIRYPREDFIVWGSGEQTRSFLYVSDCIEALVRLEEKASNPPIIVNVGSDEEVPIKRIAEKIVEISGKTIKIKYDHSKPVGPISRTANIQRAKALLGWEPKVDLDKGLKLTYLWAEKKLTKPWCDSVNFSPYSPYKTTGNRFSPSKT